MVVAVGEVCCQLLYMLASKQGCTTIAVSQYHLRYDPVQQGHTMSSVPCEKPVRRRIKPSVVEDGTTRVISDMGVRVSLAPSLLTVLCIAKLNSSANAKDTHVQYRRFAEGWTALARECKMWQ